jgi:DNA-binding NarL/FixJ family response regulator
LRGGCAASLASSGEQAIELARELQPDVILMDIKMPGINGIEATREILHTSPRTGVLEVTMFEDDDSRCSPLCEPGREATY